MGFGLGLKEVFGSGIAFSGFLGIFEEGQFGEFFLVVFVKKELKEMLKIAKLIFIKRSTYNKKYSKIANNE